MRDPIGPMATGGAQPDGGNSDAYLWNGDDGTDWGTAANWTDVTTGQTPAAAPPGAANAVTVAYDYGIPTAITGSGASASLTLEGSTDLEGQFTTGTLSQMGFYSALDLDPGATLGVSGNAAVGENSTIYVEGAGAAMTVAGTISLGDSYGNSGALDLADRGAVTAGGLSNLAGCSVSVDQTSSLEIGATNDAAAGSFTIDTGATAALRSSYIIAPTLTVNGMLTTGSTSSGSSTIETDALAGDGTIELSGTLTVTGENGLGIAGGQGLSLAFGAGADVLVLSTSSLDSAQAFAPTITGFASGDVIEWNGPLSGVSFAGGTLSLLNGATTAASLTLSGSYAHQSFVSVPVGDDNSEIVVIGAGDTKTAPAGTVPPDSYTWNGAVSGSWDSAANWTDTTLGADPASVAPGANDAVTINALGVNPGSSDGLTTVISGKGNAAALTLTGTTLLDGKFSATNLTIGALFDFSPNGLLLQAGNTLTIAGGAAVQGNGAVSVAGAGALFSVGGALTFGSSNGFNYSSSTLSVADGGAVSLAGLLEYSETFITIDQTSSLEIGAADDATAGAFTLDQGCTATINGGISASTLVLNGTLIADNAQLSASAISGSGEIQIDNSLSFGSAPSWSGGVGIDFVGTDSSLQIGQASLNAQLQFTPALSGFVGGDLIDWISGGLTSVSYAAGTLSLIAGTGTLATLTLTGNYKHQTFMLLPGNSSTDEIVVVGAGDTKTAPPGTASPDNYTWAGGSVGSWDVAANWQDTSTGSGPAAVAPGANDSVTLGSEGFGQNTDVISGAGDAASLTLNDSVLLAGKFSTGSLALGAPPYATTLYLEASDTLSVSGAADLGSDGTISVAGAGAVFTAGTLDLSYLQYLDFFPATIVASGGAVVRVDAIAGGGDATLSVDQTSSIEVGARGHAALGAVTVDRGVSFDLTGTIEAPSLVLNGNIIANGLVISAGTLSGNGTIEIGSTLDLSPGDQNRLAGGSALTIGFSGANQMLKILTTALDSSLNFEPIISGFGADDAIELDSQVTGATFSAGTLTLTDNGITVGTLHLAGNFHGLSFLAVPNGYDDSEILVVGQGDTKTAPAGTASPDSYLWNSPLAGSWDAGANWTDTSTGDDPAAVAPGANDSVTIGEYTGVYPQYEPVVTGTGKAASLTLGSAAILDGKFTVGSFTLEPGYFDQQSILDAGGTLTVSGTASVDGALSVSGAGSQLTVDGALTLGAAGGYDGNGELSVDDGGLVSVDALDLYGGVITVDASSSFLVGPNGTAAAGDFSVRASQSVNASGTITAPTLAVFGTLHANGLDLSTDGFKGQGTIDISGSLGIGSDGIDSMSGGAGLMIAFGAGSILSLGPQDLNGLGAFTPTLSGFAAGDAIVWNGPVTSAAESGGTLTLYDTYQGVTTTVGTLTLAGDYTGQSFVAASLYGESEIVVVGAGDTPTPPAGTPTPDDYVWNGAISGSWDSPGDWQDASAGQSPAAAAPGANDLVTINPVDLSYYEPANVVISGTGAASALTIDAAVLLDGAFSAGTLADNNGVSLAAGDTLAVAGGASMAGYTALTVAGAGASLTIGGTLSIGTEYSYGGQADITASDGGAIQMAGLQALSFADFSVDATSSIEVGTAQNAAAGSFTLDRGASAAGDMFVGASSVVIDGYLSGDVTLAPATLAGNGVLSIASDDQLTLDNDTLPISGGTHLTIAFTGTDGALALSSASLDKNGMLEPAVEGLGGSNVIAWSGGTLTAASYSAASGKLSLLDGTQTVATLKLDGSYAGESFAVTTNSYGQIAVVVTPGTTDLAPDLTAPAAVMAMPHHTTAVSGVSISDTGSGAAGANFTVVLTDAGGALSANTGGSGGGGAISGSGSSHMIITGLLSQVNADLSTLTFLSSVAGSDGIAIAVNDGMGGITDGLVGVSVTAGANPSGSDVLPPVPNSGNPSVFVHAGPGGMWETAIFQQDRPGGPEAWGFVHTP